MAQRTQQLTGSSESALPRAERLGAAALDRTQLRSNPGYWQRAWSRYRRNHVALVALGTSILIILFALCAPLISRYVTHYGYADINLSDTLKPPFSDGYILGSDGTGRDVLTRLAFGGRVSLLIAFL